MQNQSEAILSENETKSTGTPEETRKIVDELINVLTEKKGEDITALDITDQNSIADYIIIVTANSTPHAAGLGKAVVDYFMDNNHKDFLFKRNVETNNPWILVDAKDIIIHIFMAEEREFYNLEKIYAKGKRIY
ncbi:MAG: ribosome silencing factor [Spirochaetales bacterium]|nr:ribosome silencing factor [Spirochaetales bacterium]